MLSLTGLAMVFFTGFQTRLGMAVHVVPQSQVQAFSAQAKSALAAIPGGTLNEYIAPPHQQARQLVCGHARRCHRDGGD